MQENPARIEAIRILLDRPRDWGTAAITELRNKLATAPERFTVELLQKAHAIRYDKALADIISMVKHAARNEEPLTTAAEQVARAIEKIRRDRKFTEEQEKWLDRTRVLHLFSPVFSRFSVYLVWQIKQEWLRRCRGPQKSPRNTTICERQCMKISAKL